MIGHQPPADAPEVEPIRDERDDRDRRHGQDELHERVQREARRVLALGDRRRHDVEQVARPRLFHEPGRHRDLALEQDVEQHDAGQQVRRRGARCVVLLRDERAERPEQQHVEHRPHRDVEPAVRAAPQHVPVPAHDGPDPKPVHALVTRRAPCRCPRAAGTRDSRSPWPNMAATSSGVPSATILPPAMKTTRSHSRSTSTHVVTRHEQRGAVGRADLEQARAYSLRDVGVERRGRLVEHEQARPVQRRLHDADERALPRRQLHAHAVGEAGDAEAGEAALDRRVGLACGAARRTRRRPTSASRTRRRSGSGR